MTIKEFIQGLSKTISKELQNSIRDEISKYIDEAIDKSMKKLFIIGTAVSLLGIGSFLFLWGIATGIDKIFKMEGLGYTIFGIFGILIGILIYERFEIKKKNKE